MSGLLENKTVGICHGAVGIGEAISKNFAREGARVIVHGHPDEPVDQVVVEIRQMGGLAESAIGELEQPESARKMVKRCLDDFNALDVCVINNAQLRFGPKLGEYNEDEFEQIIRANLHSTFNTMRFTLPALMRTKGTLITISSLMGFDGQPLAGPFAAANAAINSLAKTAAREYADVPVRVINVAVGAIETELQMTADDVSEVHREELRALTPLGRYGSSEEVAHVIAFLASNRASFITGTDVFIDGGMATAHGLPGKDVHHEQPPLTLMLRHQTIRGRRKKAA